MTAKMILPCLAVAMLSLTAHAGAGSNVTRAQVYDRFFFPSGVPANYLDTPTAVKLPKTRAFKTVIPGLLYRGGGAGGKVPLTQEALKGLCEAGFSLAVYGYTEGFRGTQQIQCTDSISGQQNTLTYIAGEASQLAFEQERHETDPDGGREPECRPRVRALLERRPCFG